MEDSGEEAQQTEVFSSPQGTLLEILNTSSSTDERTLARPWSQ